MLVNKTVEFFLSEVAGWSETKLKVYCCEKQDEKPASRGEMPAEEITGTGGGLGAARDRTGCRRENHRGRQRARSGQGPDEMPAEVEAGQASGLERPGTGRDAGGGWGWAGSEKINSKESAL